MKVVVSRCYGGFGLSKLAVKEYLALKGKEAFFYEQTKYSFRHGADEYTRIDEIGEDKRVLTHCMTRDLGKTTSSLGNEGYFYYGSIERDDEDLISVVEKLGELANGNSSKLEVVEIPDGIEWEIDDYDGVEKIYECRRSWQKEIYDMKQTLETLRLLQATSSTNEKGKIISNNLHDKLFVDIMQFLTNDYIQVGLSKKKISKKVDVDIHYKPIEIRSMIDYLKQNSTGRDLDIGVCQYYLDNHVDAEDRDFVSQILTKEVKLGATSTLWNKSVPKELQVPVFDCMLAKSADAHEDKIKGDFVITTKIDGNRILIIKENGTSKAFTRTGKLYEGLESILSEVDNIPYLDNIVFDGELIANVDGTTNEVFSETQSLARSKGKNKEGLKFHMFDMLPLDEFKNGQSKENAIKRKQNISRLMNDINFKHITEVKPLYMGYDKNMIQKLMIELVEPNGLEGLMINLDKPYVTKRTDSLLKVKKFKSCDVKVIGFEEGTGKYVGMLGSLIVDYKGNPTGIGTGLVDSIREEIWNNQDKWLGRVVECKYFEESMDSKTGKLSMRFPVFMGLREIDKEVSYN